MAIRTQFFFFKLAANSNIIPAERHHWNIFSSAPNLPQSQRENKGTHFVSSFMAAASSSSESTSSHSETQSRGTNASILSWKSIQLWLQPRETYSPPCTTTPSNCPCPTRRRMRTLWRAPDTHVCATAEDAIWGWVFVVLFLIPFSFSAQAGGFLSFFPTICVYRLPKLSRTPDWTRTSRAVFINCSSSGGSSVFVLGISCLITARWSSTLMLDFAIPCQLGWLDVFSWLCICWYH